MSQSFDLIIIGGGSGGIATANKAAMLGASVALIESGDIGGTCVNVGCVPKKVMWLAAEKAQMLNTLPAYGLPNTVPHVDWPTLVKHRQQYIERLHPLYDNKLNQNKVARFHGKARFVAAKEIAVGNHILTGEHIVIATGGTPRWPTIPGHDLGIDSNGFFELNRLPKRVAVVGAGYIGIELAGILQALGAETYLIYRHDKVLRQFDPMLSDTLLDYYQQQGMHLKAHHTAEAIHRHSDNTLTLKCTNQNPIEALDSVIWAIGRTPNTADLNLEPIGVELSPDGTIVVDEWQNTSIKGVYALGDVTGIWPLTPVAIKTGRQLATRLFGGDNTAKLDKTNIPTVIYSHPPIGTVGLTESEAKAQYGEDIQIYQSHFTPMSQSLHQKKYQTRIKLITEKSSQKVLGCHLIGDNVDEILQGFAVAIKMGATKYDFDNTMAIHPTSAEELVTLT